MNHAPSLPSRTLLIVDDQPSVLVSLRFLLDDAYRVITAESGEKSVDLAVSHAIDGAIVDLHMPGLNGIETCRRLASLASSQGRPMHLWLMSAAATAESRRLALGAGAIGFLAKPFPDDLLNQLAGGFAIPPPIPATVIATAPALTEVNQ